MILTSGVIRLESGLFDDGRTASEKWMPNDFRIKYPNEVKGIKIK